MLPMTDIREESGGKIETKNLILYEPDGETVFDAIVPEYLAGLVYGGICESTASELAARRMAMDAATSNAEEMIDQLNLYLQTGHVRPASRRRSRRLLQVRKVFKI